MVLFAAKHRHQQAETAGDQATRGPGAQLTRARENWGMSREQVASTLRLPERVIVALEQDHYEDLPPPAFVRGYISGYARLVGLNAPELIAACEMHGCGDPALAAKGSLSLRKGRGDTLLRWTSYAVLAAFLGSAMLYWAGNEEITTPPSALTPAATNQIPGDTKPASTTAPNDIAGSSNSPAFGSPSSPSSPLAAADTAPAAVATAVTSGADASANNRQPGTPTNSPVGSPTTEWPTLELKFSADSWLAVRDADGKRLAWETVKAGSTRQLQGLPPLKVVLGNADAVRISIQGKPFDPTPFTNGRMARFSVE